MADNDVSQILTRDVIELATTADIEERQIFSHHW